MNKTTTLLTITLLLVLLAPQALANEHTTLVCETKTTEAEVESFELPVQVRDFNTSHIDFQNKNEGLEQGIVENELGSDGLPVYAHGEDGTTSDSTHGSEAFNQWYRNVEGVNIPFDHSITFTRTSQGTYEYKNRSYFPVDDRGFGNTIYRGDPTTRFGETFEDGDELPHNYYFTTELRFNFTYRGGEELNFEGDDDLWVFINGQLVVDIGGVHGAIEDDVTLDETKAQELGLEIGETYETAIFHAERHWWSSVYELTLGEFEVEYQECEEIQTELTCQEPTPTLDLQQGEAQTINYQDVFAGDLSQATITSQSPQDINIEEQETQARITNINHNTSTELQFTANTIEQSITCPVQATASTQGGRDYCQLETYSFDQTTPNIYITVDESGSMGSTDGGELTRLQRAKDGLQGLVPLSKNNNIGLAGFARYCDGEGVREYLKTGSHDEQTLQEAIDSLSIRGGTPMHAAIKDIREKARLDMEGDPYNAIRPKFAILIGDGQPNRCSCDYPADQYTCQDAVVEEITKLREELGIPTYIIGFNFNAPTFNRFAQAGGTTNPFNETNDYFFADDAESLVDVFNQIYESIDCRIPLQHTPQYAQGINVFFNGEQLPPERWTYDAEGNAIVLNDETCQEFEEEGATITIGSQCVDAPNCVEPTPQIIFGEADTRNVQYNQLFEGNLDYFEMSWQEPTGVTVQEHTNGQGVNITNNDAEANTQIPFTYAHPEEEVTCNLNALLTLNPVIEPPETIDPDEDIENGNGATPPFSGLETCNSQSCQDCAELDEENEVLSCLQNNNCYNQEEVRNVYNQPTTIQTHNLVRSLPGPYETHNFSTIGNFSITPDEGNRAQGYTLQHTGAAHNHQGALIAVVQPQDQPKIQVCQQLRRLNYNIETPPELIQSPLLVVGTRAFTDLLDVPGPHLFSAKVWVP